MDFSTRGDFSQLRRPNKRSPSLSLCDGLEYPGCWNPPDELSLRLLPLKNPLHAQASKTPGLCRAALRQKRGGARRFHAQDPHQFVHLSRPLAPEGGDPYRFAAALHHKWLDEGVLARDERPALYPYVIELAGGGQRLGVLGLAGLEDASEIRPHEQTLDKTLAERLALLSPCTSTWSPSSRRWRTRPPRPLIGEAGQSHPLVRHQDAEHFHVIYRVATPERSAIPAATYGTLPCGWITATRWPRKRQRARHPPRHGGLGKLAVSPGIAAPA